MSEPHDILKARLRAALRGRRRTLAAEQPQAATAAAERLPLSRLPPFQVVAGYHPVGDELDPRPLLERLAEAGAALALPVTLDRDTPLVFRAARLHALAPDAFGVPAPPPDAPVLEPDLIVAPLLAFDRHGGRLGQGGGHYDRTLANLRARRRVFVIGLAYAGQEVERVPMDPLDQRLDAILTEIGYSEVRKDV